MDYIIFPIVLVAPGLLFVWIAFRIRNLGTPDSDGVHTVGTLVGFTKTKWNNQNIAELELERVHPIFEFDNRYKTEVKYYDHYVVGCNPMIRVIYRGKPYYCEGDSCVGIDTKNIGEEYPVIIRPDKQGRIYTAMMVGSQFDAVRKEMNHRAKMVFWIPFSVGMICILLGLFCLWLCF